MQTFAHTRGNSSGRVYFALAYTSDPPSIAGWAGYIEALGAAARSTPHAIQLIVVTDGGAPNAMQRRAYAAATADARVPPFAHVFSDDAFVRGVVTAFRWLTPRAPVVSHAPRDFASVCTAASLPPEQVLYDLMTLQNKMPPVHTLRVVAESVHASRANAQSEAPPRKQA